MLEALLSPLRVGPVELPNRIVSTAHQTTLVHDHLPTEDFLAYHEARARGGTGLIVLEATAVDPSGLLTPHTLAGYRKDSAAGFARVAEAVRPHGTRLFVQLFHGGREQIASPPRTPAISASAIPSRRFHVEPRTATVGGHRGDPGRLRALCRQRCRRRARRDRGLGRARVPGRAVLHARS